MWDRHRLFRAWWMEFEFFAAGAALGWAILAYGTRAGMAERPSLAGLQFLSDDVWALIVGTLGVVQMVVVLANLRWARWVLALLQSVFWCSVTVAILQASWGGDDLPLSAALYAMTALCSLAVVGRLPREFPPRGR